MLKRIFALLVLLVPFFAGAQTKRTVKGAVQDSTGKEIAGASVRLIGNKDTLTSSTVSDGKFSFKGVSVTSFIIRVQSLGYKAIDISYLFDDKTKDIQLDPITLKQAARQLEEVVVNDKPAAIVFKQDTIEYNTDAFYVGTDDMVEDLLRQLPGIEVEPNGTVRSKGKQITRLRVNGEDFFTGDVTEFIRQLPAAIMAKLQIVDDYGDEANFTGIKIGEPEKIINLVTKPGMDRGKFGNAQLNGNTNKIFSASGDGNYWRSSKQIGARTTISTSSNATGASSYNSAGLNYRNTIKDVGFNTSYSYNNNRSNTNTNRFSETINTLGTIFTTNQNTSDSKYNSHNLNSGVNIKMGKKAFVNVSASASLSSGNTASDILSLQRGIIKQDLFTNNSSYNRRPSANINVISGYKFKKPGRSLSYSLSLLSNQGKVNEDVSDQISYFDVSGAAAKDSLLKRIINSNSNTRAAGFRAGYSEPINEKMNIDITYNFNINHQKNSFITNVPKPGDNLKQVDSLSNIYNTTVLTQRIGVNYRYHTKKLYSTIGLSLQPSIIKGQFDGFEEKVRNRTLNFSPSANLNYTISKEKTLQFGYNGGSQAPGIEQLQPVRDTRNLQNVVTGNPDLKPAFRNGFNLNYSQIFPEKNYSLDLGVAGGFVINQIVSNVVLIRDTLNSLKQETRYENVNGSYNTDFSYSFSLPLFKLDKRSVSLFLNGSAGFGNTVSFADNVKVNNQLFNFSQGARLNFSFQKNYIGTSANYFYSENSYIVGSNRQFNSHTLQLSVNAIKTIFKDAQAGVNASKRFSNGYAITNNPFLISASLSKQLLKKNQLNFTFSVNDILNQGNPTVRMASGNTITDSRTNFATRYAQVTLSMRLSKFGKEAGEM